MGGKFGLLAYLGVPAGGRMGEAFHVGQVFGVSYQIQGAEGFPGVAGAGLELRDGVVRLDPSSFGGGLGLDLAGEGERISSPVSRLDD